MWSLYHDPTVSHQPSILRTKLLPPSPSALEQLLRGWGRTHQQEGHAQVWRA